MSTNPSITHLVPDRKTPPGGGGFDAPTLAAARAAYGAALEALWAASDRNTAAWRAHTNGENVSDVAWQQAADAEEAAQTAERDAFDAYRHAWRVQNGWAV